jgi:hypothetical protein
VLLRIHDEIAFVLVVSPALPSENVSPRPNPGTDRKEQSRLFEEFSLRCRFEAFAALQSAAWRHPPATAAERVLSSEQQQSIPLTQQQDTGCGS